MKAKEIINLPAYQVNKLTGGALNEAYQTLKSVFNKRAKTFRKHGAERALPPGFRKGMQSSVGMTESEKLQALKDVSAFMRGERSTYSGWRRSELEQMESLNEALDGVYHFDSLDDFRKYGEFMGEMQTRLGEMWKVQSSQVRELFFQAQRLGVDSSQFLKNFEYWIEHAEELQKAKPLSYSGRGLKTSDYARQLHLPSINEFYRKRYSDVMQEALLKDLSGKELKNYVSEQYRPVSGKVRKKK